ncbi:phage holin family protein [Nostoc ellipsosporum NOK]|jgi:integral membrane sensor domain MASE1|nr:phage holin family protein [Nostoc ellipsosporum NOK]
MEELKEKTADLVDHLEDIADTYYRLTIINVTQKATNVASSMVVAVMVCGLSMFVLMFLGVALGVWLGDMIQSRSGGFLLAAAVYLLGTLIILAMRKKIIYPFIRNFIVRKVYD